MIFVLTNKGIEVLLKYWTGWLRNSGKCVFEIQIIIFFLRTCYQLPLKYITLCMGYVGIGIQSALCKILADAVFIIFGAIT